MVLIRAEHLVKKFNFRGETLTILKDISLEINSGTSLAIAGVSGSGKSTLLGLLAGLDLPSSGRVILNNQDLNTLSEDKRALLRAGYIGFIFQNFQLLPNLTAIENVMLPLELMGIGSALGVAKEWMVEVGLSERLNHYPQQLSGGEQQRVAIARAFSVQPRLLFADEPTGNLDQNTAKTIIDLLFKLNHEHKTTLICVTHDLILAGRCAQMVRLAGGQLIA